VTPGGSCNWYASTWRLLLLLAAASTPGGCFCTWRLLQQMSASSTTWSPAAVPPDALQYLKACSTGLAAAPPDALAACTRCSTSSEWQQYQQHLHHL
ncbi:unnamed protein product, partial [Closterium sp. Naga37s-1]